MGRKKPPPSPLLPDSVVYLETSKTSTMKRFRENSQRLIALNYFRKNAPS